MRKWSKLTRLKLLALMVALPVIGLGAATLSYQPARFLVATGPIQAGHQDISCQACHTDAPGTVRQQLQANFRYLVGLRVHPVDFGYAKLTSAACIACHERPNERHPIYRFQEPRFEKVLTRLDATSCLACHAEHKDERAFVEPTFCRLCHEDLTLKSDPLDVPHETLIAEQNWQSCLTCHDFHGNHPATVPTRLRDAYPLKSVTDYLANGPSPYGPVKTYEARKE